MASSGVLNTSGYGGRYLQFSWSIKNSLQDRIETNKTTISWELKGAGDAQYAYYETGNITLVIDGTTVYTRDKWDRFKLYSGTLVKSGEYTFTHDSNGKRSFSVSLSAGIYLADVNCTGSGSFTIDDIPRASTLTASNGTLNTEQTLKITPAASSFKHRLTYRCGDIAGYIAGSTTTYSTATDIKWTPPLGLAAENTAGTSVTITFTLYTYTSDGTHVGTITDSITCAIPTSVKPSCSIRLDSDASGVMNTYGKPVQGLSKLKLTINAQTSYGAAITAYTLTANGTKYNVATVTTDALTTAGANKIAATVKDTRGRTGSNSLTVDVLPYSAPVVSKLAVRRCDENGNPNDQGEFCQVVFSAVVSNLEGKNPPAYSLRYKKTTEDAYTDIPTGGLANVYAVVDWSYIFPADGNASYDVEATASDNHGTNTRATTLSTAFTLMNWGASGTGIAFGKVSEKENAVEFALDIHDKDDDLVKGVRYMVNLLLPVGSVVVRYDNQNPGTLYPGTTWTQITARVLRAGSAGSVGTEGSIADGSGRTYIDVAVWRRTA